MKKILSIFILLLFFISVKAQFPVNQTLGAPLTQVYSRGGLGADSGFIARKNFIDTSFANIGFLKNIPGIIIRVGSDLYMRNNAATAWIFIGGESGAFVDEHFANANLTATGDRTHDFDNFFLKINDLSELELKSTVNGTRYSIISDLKPYYTGVFLQSVFDGSNQTSLTLSNLNNGSNIYMDASSATGYSAGFINPDTILLRQNAGNIRFRSLVQGQGQASLRYDKGTGQIFWADSGGVNYGRFGVEDNDNSVWNANRTMNMSENNFTLDSLNSLTLFSRTSSQNGAFRYSINRVTDIQYAAEYLNGATFGGSIFINHDDDTELAVQATAYRVGSTGLGAPYWSISGSDSTIILNAHRYLIFADSTIGDPTGAGIYIDQLPHSAAGTLQVVARDSTDGKIYRTNITGGAAEGLQETLDAGSTLTSTEQINTGANQLGVMATSTGSTIEPALYTRKFNSNTNTIDEVFSVQHLSSGTGADGIGSSIGYYNEIDDGSLTISNRIQGFWSVAAAATRESQYNFIGVDNAIEEVYMNIQNDLVRINNNADTLATRAYARSVGGGGSSVSFGTDNQIPHMNTGGTDFDYDADFTWDGATLFTNSGASTTGNIFVVPDGGSTYAMAADATPGGGEHYLRFFRTSSVNLLEASHPNAGEFTIRNIGAGPFQLQSASSQSLILRPGATTTTTYTSTGQTFTQPTVMDQHITMAELASPSTPSPNYARIYPKADGLWYGMDDAGLETQLSNAGGGGHIIEEDGTPLTARSGLNFVGAGLTATDDAVNDETDITLDPDLETIAGLTATTDNFIVSVSSAWASRTPAQVRTTLGLVVGTDVQAFDADLTTLSGSTGTKDNTTYYGGDGVFHPAGLSKGLVLQAPTALENVLIFYTPHAITITNVQEALSGTTPSVTYILGYSSTRSGSLTNIVDSHAATSTTGTAATLTANVSVPAGSYIILTTSATSGTVNDFNVTTSFRQ